METKWTKKKIGLFVLVALMSVASLGIWMFNKPHVNVAKTKASIATTAVSILNDFETDESMANTKYLEQIVQVSGVVKNTIENKGKGIVVLKSEQAMGAVMCYLSDVESSKLETLKPGMSVSVKGICTGYLMDVVLIKCVITNE